MDSLHWLKIPEHIHFKVLFPNLQLPAVLPDQIPSRTLHHPAKSTNNNPALPDHFPFSPFLGIIQCAVPWVRAALIIRYINQAPLSRFFEEALYQVYTYWLDIFMVLRKSNFPTDLVATSGSFSPPSSRTVKRCDIIRKSTVIWCDNPPI